MIDMTVGRDLGDLEIVVDRTFGGVCGMHSDGRHVEGL